MTKNGQLQLGPYQKNLIATNGLQSNQTNFKTYTNTVLVSVESKSTNVPVWLPVLEKSWGE